MRARQFPLEKKSAGGEWIVEHSPKILPREEKSHHHHHLHTTSTITTPPAPSPHHHHHLRQSFTGSLFRLSIADCRRTGWQVRNERGLFTRQILCVVGRKTCRGNVCEQGMALRSIQRLSERGNFISVIEEWGWSCHFQEAGGGGDYNFFYFLLILFHVIGLVLRRINGTEKNTLLLFWPWCNPRWFTELRAPTNYLIIPSFVQQAVGTE